MLEQPTSALLPAQLTFFNASLFFSFFFLQCWGLNPGPWAFGKCSTTELHPAPCPLLSMPSSVLGSRSNPGGWDAGPGNLCECSAGTHGCMWVKGRGYWDSFQNLPEGIYFYLSVRRSKTWKIPLGWSLKPFWTKDSILGTSWSLRKGSTVAYPRNRVREETETQVGGVPRGLSSSSIQSSYLSLGWGHQIFSGHHWAHYLPKPLATLLEDSGYYFLKHIPQNAKFLVLLIGIPWNGEKDNSQDK